MKLLFLILCAIGLGCTDISENGEPLSNTNTGLPADSTSLSADQRADKFDFPVGKPDAQGYYNAQGFGKNTHLGDDWNGLKGGSTDLGDPIFAIANGFVSSAKDHRGGWGNVIRITHFLADGSKVESLYAHCDTIQVSANQWVKRGDQIGTIGDAHGQYLAHLHFEIRDQLGMPIGGGYSRNTKGYVDPSKFIRAHRKGSSEN